MIPTQQLLDLKALAEKATPGPWKYDVGNWEVESRDVTKFRAGVCLLNDSDSPIENGDYIAALDPSTIQFLVEEILGARKVIGFYADKKNWTINMIEGPNGDYGNSARAHIKRFGE